MGPIRPPSSSSMGASAETKRRVWALVQPTESSASGPPPRVPSFSSGVIAAISPQQGWRTQEHIESFEGYDRVGGDGLCPPTASVLRDLPRHAHTRASFEHAPRGFAQARE